MTQDDPDIVPVDILLGQVITGPSGDRVARRYRLGTVTLDKADGWAKAFRQIPDALRDLADAWDTEQERLEREVNQLED